MSSVNQMILIDCDVANTSDHNIQALYDQADIIYSFNNDYLLEDKVRSIFDKKFYDPVLSLYRAYIIDSCQNHVKKTENIDYACLNYYVISQSQPLFYLFLLKRIQCLYPTHQIILITSNLQIYKVLKADNSIISNKKGVSVFYNKKSSRGQVLKSILCNANRFSFILLNTLRLFKRSMGMIVNYSFKKTRSINHDILVLSKGKIYHDIINGVEKDRYIYSFYENINQEALFSTLLISDGNSRDSIYSYLGIQARIKAVFKAWARAIRMSRFFIVNLQYLTEDGLFIKLVFVEALRILLANNKVKACIYYDEVYSQGKFLSLLFSELKITSFGYQHALIDQYNHAYELFTMGEKYKLVYPDCFLIYDAWTKKVLEKYFQCNDIKLIKIGWKQILLDQLPLQTKDILYLGSDKHPFKIDELYGYCIENNHKLYFRLHPSHLDIKDFLSEYPNIIYLDPIKTTVEQNLKLAKWVMGMPTTAMINASVANKNTICLVDMSQILIYDLTNYGVQYVDSIEGINWGQDVNNGLSIIDGYKQNYYADMMKEVMERR